MKFKVGDIVQHEFTNNIGKIVSFEQWDAGLLGTKNLVHIERNYREFLFSETYDINNLKLVEINKDLT